MAVTVFFQTQAILGEQTMSLDVKGAEGLNLKLASLMNKHTFLHKP